MAPCHQYGHWIYIPEVGFRMASGTWLGAEVHVVVSDLAAHLPNASGLCMIRVHVLAVKKPQISAYSILSSRNRVCIILCQNNVLNNPIAYLNTIPTSLSRPNRDSASISTTLIPS